MFDETESVSRRNVLRATAGAVPAAAGAGLASAGDTRRPASAGSPPDGVDTYNVGYSALSGRAAAREAASEVVREFNFDALTVRLPDRAIAGLRERPDVRYVEENGAMRLYAQQLPWGVDRIDADRIRGVEDGDGVHVAVLDTGIDGDHGDLAGNLGTGAWVNDGCDTCDYYWGDDEGHGTAVAGIVGAIDNTTDVVGAAPAVTIHSVQVCDTDESCEHDEIAAGLEWVADQGYEIANMSFGGDHSDTIEDAVTYAAQHDVLMVAAAGNDGPCMDCVSYPAADPLTLAVSATDGTDDLADFSNQGPQIDLAAPGVGVETTDLGGGTRFFSGTSAAAPHVAGAAALVRARVPSQNLAEEQLLDKAEDVGLSSDEQGFGLVDAEAAVEEPLVETTTPVTSSGSMTMQGELCYFGDAASAEVYFEWGEEGDGLPNQTDPETLTTTGRFSAEVPVLCDTFYEYRAVADASDGDGDRGHVTEVYSGSCDDCEDQRFCTSTEGDHRSVVTVVGGGTVV